MSHPENRGNNILSPNIQSDLDTSSNRRVDLFAQITGIDPINIRERARNNRRAPDGSINQIYEDLRGRVTAARNELGETVTMFELYKKVAETIPKTTSLDTKVKIMEAIKKQDSTNSDGQDAFLLLSLHSILGTIEILSKAKLSEVTNVERDEILRLALSDVLKIIPRITNLDKSASRIDDVTRNAVVSYVAKKYGVGNKWVNNNEWIKLEAILRTRDCEQMSPTSSGDELSDAEKAIAIQMGVSEAELAKVKLKKAIPQQIKNALLNSSLNKREEEIVSLRYLEHKSLLEIGLKFGLTPQGISQICKSALDRLKNKTSQQTKISVNTLLPYLTGEKHWTTKRIALDIATKAGVEEDEAAIKKITYRVRNLKHIIKKNLK